MYGLRTFEQTAYESNAMFLRALVMRLLAWFSLAALVLGGVGVYGVLVGGDDGADARDRRADGARRHARRDREAGLRGRRACRRSSVWRSARR